MAVDATRLHHDGSSHCNVQRGVQLGCVAMLLTMAGFTMTMPFLQSRRDELGCDALCYGSMTSVRSALGLVGSTVIGRLSDRYGRQSMLWVGVVGNIASLLLGVALPGLWGMWVSMLPRSLLDNNWAVTKALFSDYYSQGESTGDRQAADLTGALGKLGMAVGFSFMLGGAAGSLLLSSFAQASICSAIVVACAGPLIMFMPAPPSLAPSEAGSTGFMQGLRAMLSLPVLRMPGSMLMIFVRTGMGMAFHIFITIWTPSLATRFAFTPREHGQFMGFVGLAYALSQGFMAKPLVAACGTNLAGLLLVCIVILTVGRVLAMLTTSLIVVYISFGVVLSALGVANAVLAAGASSLSQVHSGDNCAGGLFGVLEAVESAAGIFGPTIGGVLARVGEMYDLPHLVLASVVVVYACVFGAIAIGYQRHVVSIPRLMEKVGAKDE